MIEARHEMLCASHFSKQMVPHGVHYGVHQDHFYGPGPGWDRQEGYQQNNYRRN